MSNQDDFYIACLDGEYTKVEDLLRRKVFLFFDAISVNEPSEIEWDGCTGMLRVDCQPWLGW